MIPTISRHRPHTYALVVTALAALMATGCQNAVEPELTAGEKIRQILVQGGDESILFSTASVADQTGTDVFDRTIDRVGRGFVNIRWPIGTDEVPDAQTFVAELYDTVFGTLTVKVTDPFGTTFVTRPYQLLAYGGLITMHDYRCFTCSNEWQIYKMVHRNALQTSSKNEPKIVTMALSDSSPK